MSDYPRSRSRREAEAARQAASAAGRALFAAAFAQLVMAAEYETRNEAEAARDRLHTVFMGLLEEGSLDVDCFHLISEILATAVTHLTLRALDLKPLVRVETGVPLPASLVAWQLYGDPTRAGELVRRNGVATPFFMPTSLEAIAP